MMSLLCDAEEWLIFNEGREISYKIARGSKLRLRQKDGR